MGFAGNYALAQNVALGLTSASGAPGAAVTLNINSTASGSLPAALEWTVQYSTSDFSSASVSAGPMLAAKSLSCANGTGSVTCVAWGLNDSTITNGTVASLTLNLSATTTNQSSLVMLLNGTSTTPAGAPLSTSVSNGAVTILQTPKLNSFSCNPLSISPSAGSTCTVNLSSAALTGGATVTLGSSPAGANIPSSLVIQQGATSGTFSVTAGNVSTATPVTLTASYSGLSSTFSITVNPPSGMSNLSLNQPATQSSTYAPGLTDASKAVDGNTDGNYNDGSVSHTNDDANAWWEVDLGASASVSSIVIWNRTDCCGSRLSDYWVFVSDTPFLSTDTPTTLQGRAGTWSSHQTVQPNPSATITIPGAEGRYVRVQLTGTNYLAMAEVQVLGVLQGPLPSDVALNRTVTQSSTYAPGFTDASKAVDGNTDGNYSDGSVSHTNDDANAWWEVDLGSSATISSISVWNRTDCCSSRLSDYWVFVSNVPFLATDTPTTLQNRAGTWSSHQTTMPNPSASIVIPGAEGRYVRVQLTGTNYLNLAEVQVFGH